MDIFAVFVLLLFETIIDQHPYSVFSGFLSGGVHDSLLCRPSTHEPEGVLCYTFGPKLGLILLDMYINMFWGTTRFKSVSISMFQAFENL